MKKKGVAQRRYRGLTATAMTKRMIKIRGGLVASGLGLLSALQMMQVVAQEVSFTSEQVWRGEELYANACAVCHLSSLQGAFEAPALRGQFR